MGCTINNCQPRPRINVFDLLFNLTQVKKYYSVYLCDRINSREVFMWPLKEKRKRKRRHIKNKHKKSNNRRKKERRRKLDWKEIYMDNGEPEIS